LLAMDVNDNAGSLTPRGVLKSIASKLAPTGVCVSSVTWKNSLHRLFFYAYAFASSPAKRQAHG